MPCADYESKLTTEEWRIVEMKSRLDNVTSLLCQACKAMTIAGLKKFKYSGGTLFDWYHKHLISDIEQFKPMVDLFGGERVAEKSEEFKTALSELYRLEEGK